MSNLGQTKSGAIISEDSASSYSPAVQDYLRALYQVATQNHLDSRVTTSQLAERLAVRPASVTAMLQKLAATAPPLVDYHKSYGARLTYDGERAALAVVRCHRLLELYLHEKLGYGWDEVHEEADRLEHVISPAMTERIERALGNPTRDPHGHAIPAADLSLPHSTAVPLTMLPPGVPAVVRAVADEDAGRLRYLAEVGLRPGAAIVVDGNGEGMVSLMLDGHTRVAVRGDVAAHVLVDVMACQPGTSDSPIPSDQSTTGQS